VGKGCWTQLNKEDAMTIVNDENLLEILYNTHVVQDKGSLDRFT